MHLKEPNRASKIRNQRVNIHRYAFEPLPYAIIKNNCSSPVSLLLKAFWHLFGVHPTSGAASHTGNTVTTPSGWQAWMRQFVHRLSGDSLTGLSPPTPWRTRADIYRTVSSAPGCSLGQGPGLRQLACLGILGWLATVYEDRNHDQKEQFIWVKLQQIPYPHWKAT